MDQLISKKIEQDLKGDGNYIAFSSTLAGYHKFKVRPIAGPQFPMVMMRESSNIRHGNAITINSFDSSKYSERAVQQADGREIFGKIIGRVPKKLADILAPLMDKNLLLKGLAFFTGKVIQKGKQEGGGPHLCCIYLLKLSSKEHLDLLNEQIDDDCIIFAR